MRRASKNVIIITRAYVKKYWDILTLLFILLIFIFVKTITIAPRFSDGNIYLYIGKLVSQGQSLYKDVFYTSPPLLPMFSAIWGKLTNFSWQLFALLPILLTSIEAIFIYLISKKHASSTIAVLSTALYLFSFMVLSTTDFASDIHFTLPLLLAGTYLFIKDQTIPSALIIALATGIKLYAIIWLLPLLTVLLLKKQFRQVLYFLGSALTTILIINVIGYLIGDKTYLQNAFFLQFHKYEAINKWKIITFLLKHDLVLILTASFLFTLNIRKPTRLLIALLSSLLLFYTIFPDLYYLYFKMLIAILVVGIAVWSSVLVKRGNKELVYQTLFAVTFLSVLTSYLYYATTQRNSSVIYPFNKIVKYVMDNPPSTNALYGDYEFTALVANETNMDIFQNRVDNNPKFFVSGIFSYDKLEKELKKNKVEMILTKGYTIRDEKTLRGGWEQVASTDFFNTNCNVEKAFPNNRGQVNEYILIWRCTY